MSESNASSENEAQRIFGQRASFYTGSDVHRDPQILERVVAGVSPEKSWFVLDVGTGTGHTALALAPHVRRVVAIDLTSEMLLEAAELSRQGAFDNVKLCRGDAHALPFHDEVFQAVTCRRAAHHFSRIDDAIAEMRRVLVPGGRLVIDDRSVPEDDPVDTTMNELDRLHDASHVREYRPSEWRGMLERHGFLVDSVEPYSLHRPISSLTRDVSAEKTARIHHILDRLESNSRALFDLRTVDGKLHLNHWYVLVTAEAPRR